MPDSFKILQESFGDQPPLPEQEGFHDFNALSRIAPPLVTPDEGEDTRATQAHVQAVSGVRIDPSSGEAKSGRIAPDEAGAGAQPRMADTSVATPAHMSVPVASAPTPAPPVAPSVNAPAGSVHFGAQVPDARQAGMLNLGAQRPASPDFMASAPTRPSRAEIPETTPTSRVFVQKQADDGVTVTPQAMAGETDEAWRALPVSELLARLRAAPIAKPEVQRRLHGIFRR